MAAFVGGTARGPVAEPRQVSSFSEFERTFGGLHADSDLSYSVSHFFLNGGATCWVVRTNGDSRAGIHALDAVDVFNMLCLPDNYDTRTLIEAINYAETRRAMVIVDIDPAVDTFEGARRWISDGANAALKRPNAAAWFPRVHLADPLQNGALRAFPNSGVLAGLWARTDRERSVWKAPAGREALLHGVDALDHPLSNAEMGVLNATGLNSLRTLPGRGTLSWGARTLAGADSQASEWKYLPVRRTALFVEESIHRGTRFAVFEPNAEPLWAQIRQAVDAFMNALFRQGAFQGSSAKDAYFVKCDASTTTQADVHRGHVNVLVGFAPLKPAEFVIISIRQIAGQSRP